MKRIEIIVLNGLFIGLIALNCPARTTAPKPAQAGAPVQPAEVSFRRDVLPVLQKLAGKCHTVENQAGNYLLDSYEAVMAGGTDSIPNVVPGKPDSSLLYIYLLRGHPYGERPDSAQLAIIRAWILQGAKNN
ncbi:MAG: c-type cytochrome domain-containing protein [candidate division WOR-3 bacterium]